MLKRIINRCLSTIGYKIVKVPSIDWEIKQGKYNWLRELNINTIIDVGANDGGFALKINKILPDAFIYSFEPLRDVFDKLHWNTRSLKNIKLFNSALGEAPSEKEFFINEFSPSSSFLPINESHVNAFPYTGKFKSEPVRISTLDSFKSQISFNPKVLLKLDVQGYEVKVLEGAREVIKEVDLILTEVSFEELYALQPLFDDIYQYLKGMGFIYAGNLENLTDPVSSKILQADAVFIRNSNG